MPKIIVKGTVIDLPNSGSSPDWAPAIIEAFQSIADAVNVFTGTYDVAPQTINIDAYPNGSNIPIDNLTFPPADVRAFTVFYTVYRKTTESAPAAGDAVEVSETGTLECVYNNNRPSGQKWEIGRMGENDASILFHVTDIGQVEFSTLSLTGINHSGLLAYRALSILNTI
jgi:hypothetical protein